jgi:hypothetical protein
MGVSKIKTVTKTENTWQGQSGTMYDYDVVLEDGTDGVASSTSAENTPYGEGDEVEYTKTENKWGVKLRIKKAGGDFGGGGFKQNPETQKRIENSWALQTAVQIMGVCDEGVTYTQYLKQCSDLAKTLLLQRDSLN